MLDFPLLILGLLLVAAYLLAMLFEKFNLPHILSYLTIGFIGGNFVFTNIIRDVKVQSEISHLFEVFEILALGLIGFQIGTELHIKDFFKNPKELSILVLSNVIGTFLIVFVIIFPFVPNIAVAILLAALTTSTAPAAVVEIIRKLRAKGPVSEKIQWILAFDDVVAVIFVEIILVFSIIAFGGNITFGEIVFQLFKELGYAIIIGIVIGLTLNYILSNLENKITKMEITIGFTILAIGLCEYLGSSAITATMFLGATVINVGQDDFEGVQDVIDIVVSPIIAIFFIIIGLKTDIGFFNPFPIFAITYFGARAIGKFFSVYFAGQAMKYSEPQKSSLGLGLLPQGGVVLGLAAVASEKLIKIGESSFATFVLTSVIISTILSEFIGAISTDFAIKRAGEEGKAGNANTENITHHQ